MRLRDSNEVLGRVSTPAEGYKALAASVIAMACDDYIRAYLVDDAIRMNTIEKFFKSQRFEMFSDGIDGAYMVRRLKDIARAMKKDKDTRAVYMYDENGTIQNRYASASEAADDFHGDLRSITRSCNNGTKCYGHYWRYADV